MLAPLPLPPQARRRRRPQLRARDNLARATATRSRNCPPPPLIPSSTISPRPSVPSSNLLPLLLLQSRNARGERARGKRGRGGGKWRGWRGNRGNRSEEGRTSLEKWWRWSMPPLLPSTMRRRMADSRSRATFRDGALGFLSENFRRETLLLMLTRGALLSLPTGPTLPLLRSTSRTAPSIQR